MSTVVMSFWAQTAVFQFICGRKLSEFVHQLNVFPHITAAVQNVNIWSNLHRWAKTLF